MSGHHIEPLPVIELVERYVSRELGDAQRYENRAPLDDSGIWSLHELARHIYAAGVTDGAEQERARAAGERRRQREAKETP